MYINMSGGGGGGGRGEEEEGEGKRRRERGRQWRIYQVREVKEIEKRGVGVMVVCLNTRSGKCRG